MNISMVEAIRLKNELSSEIGKLQYSRGEISYGQSFEGGDRVDDQEMVTCVDHMNRSLLLLNMSLEINNVIDRFNKENLISETVRKIKNNQLLLSMWDSVLSNSEPKKGSRKVKMDSKFETQTYEFKPHVSKSEVRKMQKELRASNRQLQAKIDKANGSKVEVSFTYEDFEDLCSVE